MKSTSINPESTWTRSHGRGSALLLVIVSLTLMAMLGAAYIQMARVDRFSTRQVHREKDAINSVVEATLSHIQAALSNDVLDDNGFFFNPRDSANGGLDEPHDYPYTADVDWPVVLLNGTEVDAKGGQYDDTWLASTAPNFGPDADPDDDVWPHITNLNGIFLRNVGKTNHPIPTEDVINLGGANNTDTNIPIPDDNADDWADADGDGIKDSRWTWAPTIKVGDVMYVMAVRIIDNSSLININAATAMTNDGNVGWGANSTTWPRGYFPTGIDLSRLLARSQSVVGPWLTELQNLLNVRDTTTAPTPLFGAPTPLGLIINNDGTFADPNANLNSRYGAWWFNTSLYGDPGNPVNKFSIEDELELRYRGGLNNPNIISTAEIQMPTALMEDQDPNSGLDPHKYDQVNSVATPYQYFRGNAQTFTPTFQAGNQQFPAIRHMLTATSGAAVFATNHDGIHTNTAPTLKYDLVYQDGGADLIIPLTNPTNQENRIENIAARLEQVFTITDNNPNVLFDLTPKLTTNAYLGLQINDPSPNTPNTSALLIQISREFAMAIQDYSDTDSTLSSWTDPATNITYYGMEMLPFLREVYIQAGYRRKDSNNDDGDNNENTGNFDVHDFDDGNQAVAVELGNPFERSIPDTLLNNRVRIAIFQGGTNTPVSSAVLAGMPPNTNIPSHGNTIVYSNPFTPVNEDGNGTDLANDLGFAGGVALPAGSLRFNVGQSVTVALQIDVNFDNANPPNWVTYDQLTDPNFAIFGASYPIAPEDPLAISRHAQGSVVRPCTNSIGGTPSVHYLSNINKGLVTGVMRQADQPTYRINQDKLGANDKTTTGVPPQFVNIGVGHVMLDNFQLPLADRQFLSVAELGWIHMFGFSDAPNGDFPQRLSGLGPGVPINPNVNSTQNPSRWTLHFRQTNDWLGNPDVPVTVPDDNDISPALDLPHAAMVMDQFTTLSPRNDLADNDNDDQDNDPNTGADNDKEQFVPGTINLNTVPLHLATLAAPLPENINDVQALNDAQRMMEMIASYRDSHGTDLSNDPNRLPFNNLPIQRTEPGIASLGELIFINPPIATPVNVITTQYGNRTINNNTYQMQFYGNNEALQPGNSNDPNVIDLYPLPERPPTPTPYNPSDSAEQAMARFQFLSQAFTTRSDIFTAYVVIQGFPARDMSDSGGVPVESIRFFAVLDRSGMTTENDQPRILGIYGLE